MTPLESRFAVREALANVDTRERRAAFFRKVFVVGVGCAVGAGVVSCFYKRSVLLGLFALCWLISVVIYTECLTIPRTFMQDMDLRWHLNPWQEALQRLAADNRQTQGILLLIALPILRMLGTFVYWSAQ
jgi:hypothetical protein